MGRSGGILVVLLCLFAGLTAVGFVILFDQVEHLALFLLIPCLFILGAIPIAARLWKGTFDLFEVTVPYFAMYFLYYGAGAVFVLFVEGAQYDWGVIPYLDAALAVCTLGFAAAMVGYGLTGRVMRPRLEGPGPSLGWLGLGVLFTIGYAGEMTYASLEYVPVRLEVIVSGLDSMISQLSFLSTFSLFYALYMLMAGKASRPLKVILMFWMIPLELLALFMRVGNKTTVMLALGLPLVAFWYARRKVPWKSVAAATLLVIFVIFPLYYTYRSVRGVHYTRGYRVERSIELLRKMDAKDYAENSLQTVARRLAIINSTAVIIRECGTHVDYQYGNTLWLGVISVAIPRILWPEKPHITTGIQFGKTFHITHFQNYSAVSESMAGELYWNLHVPGVIAGMFLMGVWLRGLYARFGANRGANALRLAMYVPLMYSTVVNAEAEIGGFFASLVKTTLILLAIEKILMLVETVRERQATGREIRHTAVTVR